MQYIEHLITARGPAITTTSWACSSTCDSGERLTEAEVRGLMMSLVVGGFETTASQLGSSVYTLMTHRNVWHELLDERVVTVNCQHAKMHGKSADSGVRQPRLVRSKRWVYRSIRTSSAASSVPPRPAR